MRCSFQLENIFASLPAGVDSRLKRAPPRPVALNLVSISIDYGNPSGIASSLMASRNDRQGFPQRIHGYRLPDYISSASHIGLVLCNVTGQSR